ncbi:MAG: PH domain-containing protein [Gammaproteobacteria bacterium]|nr:PH domain-containing protein [Gammaproteobacteria bacterium]
MRDYVKKTLLEGERIILMSHRHWIVFMPAIIWLVITLYFYFSFSYIRNLAIFPLILTVVQGFLGTVDYLISEIAVTNMRVVVKIGFIARSSYETLINNVASIDVTQPFWGRVFGYGTVIVYDTGYRATAFSQIPAPLEFRRTVQSQIEGRIPRVQVVPDEEK